MNVAADMQSMVDFSIAVLTAVCDFLMTPPVFYLFGLVCFVLVCQAVKVIMFGKGGRY